MTKSRLASVHKLTLSTVTLRDLATHELVAINGGRPPVSKFPACTQNAICQ